MGGIEVRLVHASLVGAHFGIEGNRGGFPITHAHLLHPDGHASSWFL